MIRFWAICSNTFIQTIRQPIYLVLLMITFLTMPLLVVQSGWTLGLKGGDYFETDQIFLREMGLATLLVAGLLLGAFAASNVIGREIRDKTALTVISKPLSRFTFFIGKYVGVALAVTLGYYLSMLSFLLVVRHGVMPTATDHLDMPVIVLSIVAVAVAFLVAMAGNYLFGWTFTSSMIISLVVTVTLTALAVGFIGKTWVFVPFGTDIRGSDPWYPFEGSLIAGLILTFLAVHILVAVAVSASARFGEVLTLLICLGLFAVGMIHPFLFGRHSDLAAARMLGWVFPKLTYFDKLDAISNGKEIPLAYLGWSGLYAVLYIAGALLTGLAIFQNRQMDAGTASSSMPGLTSLMGRLGQAFGGILAVVIGPILLSNEAFWTAGGIAASLGLMAFGAVVFVLWTLFGRGVKWSWSALLALHVLVLARIGLIFSGMDWAQALRFGPADMAGHLQAAVALLVIVLLSLPKTRRHVQGTACSGLEEMNLPA